MQNDMLLVPKQGQLKGRMQEHPPDSSAIFESAQN